MKRKLAIGLMTTGVVGMAIGCITLTIGYGGLVKALKGGGRHE